MTPKKRHLLDILRDEQSRETIIVPSDDKFRPKVNVKAVGAVFIALMVFYFSYQMASSDSPDDSSNTVATAEHYCVKAFSSNNVELARKWGTKLNNNGYNVQLASRKVSSQEVIFELYVGDQTSREALSKTLAELRAMTLDGAQPFAKAEIGLLQKN